MDRMSPLDASFLHIEDENSHMHIGSVAIFDGPPPGYDEILRMVRGKLPLVPRYRQKVRFVPGRLARPAARPLAAAGAGQGGGVAGVRAGVRDRRHDPLGDGLVHGRQRGRAHRIDSEARPGEVECMGHPVGDGRER